MPRLLRHCLARLRLPALGVLLLAVMANPLLAALGDLHELGSGKGHLHSLAEHATGSGDHDPLDAPRDGDNVGSDLLHALMHASHCCGHPTAVPAAFVAALPFMAPSTPASMIRVLQPAARLDAPLRPPIAA